MRPLKIISVILGILFALAGVAFVTSGGFVLGVCNSQRDPSGFFSTPSQTVGSYGFALTAPDINAQLGPRWEKWGPAQAQATVRITGSSEMPAPLFIGIAPTSQVSKYLSGVARDRIKSIDLTAGSVQYEHVDGMTMPAAPGKQSFWVAKAQGTGAQTLEWRLQQGDWTVVVMNGDASAPVAATMTLGARFGILNTLVIGLTAAGFVLVAIGGTLIALGTRRRRRASRQQPRVAWSDPAERPVGWQAAQGERPAATEAYPASPAQSRGYQPSHSPRPPQQPPRSSGGLEKPTRDPSAQPEWEL
jgi:hypothetical protein